MIQLLPEIRTKVPNRYSTYGRIKVKTIQLFLEKYTSFVICHYSIISIFGRDVVRYYFIDLHIQTIFVTESFTSHCFHLTFHEIPQFRYHLFYLPTPYSIIFEVMTIYDSLFFQEASLLSKSSCLSIMSLILNITSSIC